MIIGFLLVAGILSLFVPIFRFDTKHKEKFNKEVNTFIFSAFMGGVFIFSSAFLFGTVETRKTFIKWSVPELADYGFLTVDTKAIEEVPLYLYEELRPNSQLFVDIFRNDPELLRKVVDTNP